MDNLAVLNDDIKQPFLTLKVKILVLIATLLTVTLYSYVLYTQNLLIKDKETYVYESILDKANTISNQLYSTLNISKSNIKALSILQEENTEKAVDLINKLPFILIQQRIVKVNQNWVKLAELANQNLMNVVEQDDSGNVQKKISDISYDTFTQVIKKGKIKSEKIFSISYDKNHYLGYLIKNNEQDYEVAVLYLPELQNELRGSELFKNYIFTQEGSALLVEKNPEFTSVFNDIQKNETLQGSQRKKIGEKDVLISFIKDNAIGLLFISVTDARNVFNIFKLITKKSIYFGLIILGLAFTIGIFFSVSITNPLSKLMEHLKKVGEGNFSERVKIKTSDEIFTLGKTFNWMTQNIERLLVEKNNMIEKLESLTNELEILNKSLEEKVAQRTAELKSTHDFMGAMINSLDQGLVVFDQENTCHEIYTKASEEIYGQSPSGMKFYDLLKYSKEEEVNTFNKWSLNMFKEAIPFNSLKRLGPQTIESDVNFHDKDFRFIKLDYFPMRDTEEKIQNIIAVATDQTESRRSTLMSKEKEKQVNIILKVLNNKDSYFSFLREVEQYLFAILNIMESEQITEKDFNTVLMHLHSIKGVSQLYFFHDLSEKSHETEQLFYDIADDNYHSVFDSEPKYKQSVLELVSTFKDEINNTKEVMGELLDQADENSKNISMKDIQGFKDELSKSSDQGLVKKYEYYFLKSYILNSFSPYRELIEDTKKLKKDKSFASLKFEGQNIKIYEPFYKDFFNSLIHLFRNCIEHGVENVEKREELGKNPAGQIKVGFYKELDKQNNAKLIIKIADDGKGIDPQVIRAKCIELGYEKTELINDDDIKYVIFDERFSTTEVADQYSGRGVGMSAIKSEVEKLGGTIQIQSQINKGSEFSFTLPLK